MSYYRIWIFCFLVVGPILGQDSDYTTKFNISYYPDSVQASDIYLKEKCVLDIYYPSDIKKFSTVVWLHGGGLEGGEKLIPERLKNQGFGIVTVNYRLSPKVKNPVYLQDAAAAVSWVFKNIVNYGGDADKIFISGHSAGGYLANMIGMDRKWLERHKIDADKIAGLIPFSGHTITHFTIRKEKGISRTQPIIDQYAPLFYVRNDAPPILLITGDRELELLGRYEENAYFMRMMRLVGHKNIDLYELKGQPHDMRESGYPLLIKFILENTK